MRRWRGQVPDGGTLIGAYKHGDAMWALFARDRKLGWQNFKLAADAATGKANYWLGWNDKRRELAHWPDASALRKQLPEVYEWVLNECDGYDATRKLTSIIVSDYSLDEADSSRIVPLASLRLAVPLVSQIGIREAFEAQSITPYRGQCHDDARVALPPIGGSATAGFDASVERGAHGIAPFLSGKGQCEAPRDGLPNDISDLI